MNGLIWYFSSRHQFTVNILNKISWFTFDSVHYQGKTHLNEKTTSEIVRI
jgi:hypothetical protein